MSHTINTNHPAWCDQREPDGFDTLSVKGAANYGVEVGTEMRTHSRSIADAHLVGGALSVEIEQSEFRRNGVIEQSSAVVALYPSDEPLRLTPTEARNLAATLAAALLRAAVAAEVPAMLLASLPATREEAIERLDSMGVAGILSVAEAVGMDVDQLIKESQAAAGAGWTPDDLPSREVRNERVAASQALAKARVAERWISAGEGPEAMGR